MDHTYKTARREIQWNMNKTFPLYIWGDLHRDTPSCDIDRFRWFLRKATKDPDAMYLGMGDYHDFASSKEQKLLQNSDLHDTTIKHFDHIVQEKNRKLAVEIGQMRGKLLGLIGGNHTWKLQNGKFADEDLAERMATDYLGWLCFLRLTFKFPGRSGSNTETPVSINVDIVACHGRAAGKLIGTSINSVNELKTIFPTADIYIMGHDHQRGAWPISCLIPIHRHKDNIVKLKEHRQYLVRSGSFLKSYTENADKYTTSRLLRPADLGVVKLLISFHREKKNNQDYIVTDIESVV